MKIIGFDNLTDVTSSLFNFKYPIFLGFFTSIIGLLNYYIQNFIWANPAHYWALIFLILLDFILGVIRAKKYKMLVPRKLPRFLITIFTYTFLLYLSTLLGILIPVLIVLPAFTFALFVLTSSLSIVKNLGILGWLPEPIAYFIEEKIGMKVEEILNIDIDNLSFEYSLKNQGILTDMYNYSNAKSVTLITFEGHNFRFQNAQTVGKAKYVVGNSSFNENEIFTMDELDDFFNVLGIRSENIHNWGENNKFQLSYTYIFKLEGVIDDVIPPILIVDTAHQPKTTLDDELVPKLRKSCDNLVVNLNKQHKVKTFKQNKHVQDLKPISNVNEQLEIPDTEIEDNFDEIGNLYFFKADN